MSAIGLFLLSCQTSKQCADLLEQEPYFRYNESISSKGEGASKPIDHEMLEFLSSFTTAYGLLADRRC